MSRIQEFRKVAFKDTSFANLMRRRIYNVLLIATKYDAFMLEDDGRVDEQIFNEYTSLSLRYPPRFTLVTTEQEAIAEMSVRRFELVIFMPNMTEREIFATPKSIKQHHPAIPIVVLTPFSKEVSKCIANEDLSSINYVFSWLGNSELLMAIIKLMEDGMNVHYDTESVGVQIILLIEDSIRFYSAALPHLYRFVLQQSREFAKEALNEHQKTLRMRGRPKIMLARNYEEAVHIYAKYKNNLLGVISDMSFMRNGVKDPIAGYRFCSHIIKDGCMSPVIIQSSDPANKQYASKINASFIYKQSKNYPRELQQTVMKRFGFGDFIIINPDTGNEIMRIKDLKDLQNNVFNIPDNSLRYHLANNHFSRFLYSRAMFPPAELLRQVDVNEYADMEEARRFIFDTIVQYRKMKNVGIVAVYQKERFDEYSNFARIGEGSLGGKGRGLAFIGSMIKMHPHLDRDNLTVNIPKTVVLCTDIFDRFMESNNLYSVALNDIDDEDMLYYFLHASLPAFLIEDLMAFLEVVKSPVAVRSSSLLEDAHYQPFAGVYSTYMVPAVEDKYEMLQSLSAAIKGVYASVYYRDSKAYMTATSNLIESEKMAIVLQEVVGRQYGNHYYPTISGVAKSLNFYPLGDEKPEDGIVNLAIGLGKYVVDGHTTLRFSPRHPHNILQLSTTDFALRETQKYFLALDMQKSSLDITSNDAFNLVKLTVKDAEADGAIKYLVSTYDARNNTILNGYYPEGRKIISFASILQYDRLPLSEMLCELLAIGSREMGRPVEIEFAVDIKPDCCDKGMFYMLQIRPIVDRKETIDEDLQTISPSDTILYSENVLGHGVITDVRDILYVRTDRYNPADNQAIAAEIEQINRRFTSDDRGYVLVGLGRWGSSDPWLGIPVKWSHISNARIIAEYSIDSYRIDPSQGTHFFQNLTSNGAGYFTVNPNNGGWFNEAFLNAQPATVETEHLRLVHFYDPLTIKMDGKKGIGVVYFELSKI